MHPETPLHNAPQQVLGGWLQVFEPTAVMGGGGGRKVNRPQKVVASRDIFDILLNNPVLDVLSNVPVFCSTGALALGGLGGERELPGDRSVGIEGTGILVSDSKEGVSTGVLVEGFGEKGRVGTGAGAIIWDDKTVSPVVFATLGGKGKVPGTKVGAGAEVGVFLTDGHYLGSYFQFTAGKTIFGLGIYGDLLDVRQAKNCGP